MNGIKAISLWQPWASCVAVGSKKNETRGWYTPYRGLLAIHAARKWSLDLDDDARVFRESYGVPLPERTPPEPGKQLSRWLPLGCVVALAEFVECVRMSDEWIKSQTDLERRLGGYEAHTRFGWILSNVLPLRTPVPAQGRQSLWDLDESTSLDVVAEAVALADVRQGQALLARVGLLP